MVATSGCSTPTRFVARADRTERRALHLATNLIEITVVESFRNGGDQAADKMEATKWRLASDLDLRVIGSKRDE